MRDLEDSLEVNQPLVFALRDPDADVRMRALDRAAEEIDDELAEEMLRLLRPGPAQSSIGATHCGTSFAGRLTSLLTG